MNPLEGKNTVSVVSTLNHDVGSAHLVVTCVGLDGSQQQSHFGPFELPALKTTQLPGAAVPTIASTTVTFAKLELFAPAGKVGNVGSVAREGQDVLVSRNVYWLSSAPAPARCPADFSSLQAWRSTHVIDIEAKILQQEDAALLVELANATQQVGFWIELKVVKGDSRVGSALCSEDLVLPIYYSENYVTLFPGESRRVRIAADQTLAKGFSLAIRGWNVRPTHFRCSATNLLTDE